MKYIKKCKTGIGYRKLLKIHKSEGCYDDTKNDNSKIPKVTTRTDILNDLLQEQGFICAYCMRKISVENAKIEHIIGQSYVDDEGNSIGRLEDTNYDNILAVCQGDFCLQETHCDNSRSKYQNNKPLLEISPLNEPQMKHIKFTQSGKVYYLALDKETTVNDTLNHILNLNCDAMIEERANIIKAVKRSLSRYKFNKRFAQKQLEYWQAKNSTYKPFCQVAIFELQKHI